MMVDYDVTESGIVVNTKTGNRLQKIIRRIFQISLGHVQTTQQPPGFIGHMCEKRLYWHID